MQVHWPNIIRVAAILTGVGLITNLIFGAKVTMVVIGALLVIWGFIAS